MELSCLKCEYAFHRVVKLTILCCAKEKTFKLAETSVDASAIYMQTLLWWDWKPCLSTVPIPPNELNGHIISASVRPLAHPSLVLMWVTDVWDTGLLKNA